MIAVTTHRTATPAPSPAIACAVAPRRVVWPVRRRSQRPLSSSPRSSLVLVEQPPDGAEDHERHGDLEDGEARYRLELRCWPEQGTHGLVGAVRCGQSIALRRCLVERHVADLGRGDGDAEDAAPEDPRTSGLTGAQSRDHGGGRSLRARAGPTAILSTEPKVNAPWPSSPYWARNNSSNEGSRLNSSVTPTAPAP